MKYFKREDEDRIIDSIRKAEAGNRGEVQVHVERRCPGPDPLERARELFEEHKMTETRDRTGVLLYVAVKDRKAAVFADAGIHGAAEPGFWQQVVGEISNGYREKNPVAGIEQAVGRIGELLRQQVPGVDLAGDELKDRVTTD